MHRLQKTVEQLLHSTGDETIILQIRQMKNCAFSSNALSFSTYWSKSRCYSSCCSSKPCSTYGSGLYERPFGYSKSYFLSKSVVSSMTTSSSSMREEGSWCLLVAKAYLVGWGGVLLTSWATRFTTLMDALIDSSYICAAGPSYALLSSFLASSSFGGDSLLVPSLASLAALMSAAPI